MRDGPVPEAAFLRCSLADTPTFGGLPAATACGGHEGNHDYDPENNQDGFDTHVSKVRFSRRWFLTIGPHIPGDVGLTPPTESPGSVPPPASGYPS